MAAEGLGESNTGKISLPEALSQPERCWGYSGHILRPQCERGRSLFSAIMVER